MSLDGFIAGSNDGPGNGLGDGGHRLHDWLFGGQPIGSSRNSWPPIRCERPDIRRGHGDRCGCCGRRTFEHAGGWDGDHHDGVPIFVLSRNEPDSETGKWPLVSYLGDVETSDGPGKGGRR